MRVLAVTNLFPTAQNPVFGTFVASQINSLRQANVEVDTLFVDRLRHGMASYLGLRRNISERIREFCPALVHVMYGGIMADIVTRSVRDRPVVVSFCGSDLLGELLSGFARKLISTYGVLCSHRAASRAAGVVVKSRNLREALLGTTHPSKIRIIPNGVDLSVFRPLDRQECRAQLGWDLASFHILFPTNAGDPRKRKPLAQAAVQELSSHGVRAVFHELKGIPHQEVPVWLNASDAVLVTSLHEGSPNIVKEAMACNVSVVSVDVGDVRERIAGVEGCYLASPNPKNLAHKLFLVTQGPKRTNGRIKMQELSLERVAQELTNFYEELLLRWKTKTTFSVRDETKLASLPNRA